MSSDFFFLSALAASGSKRFFVAILLPSCRGGSNQIAAARAFVAG
jgi:hypothetical protein